LLVRISFITLRDKLWRRRPIRHPRDLETRESVVAGGLMSYALAFLEMRIGLASTLIASSR
jgi:hypothetical protein